MEMYSIGEIEEMLGISASALRYYEKEGIIPTVARNEQGRRIYTTEQIQFIRMILMLKRTGMSVDELQEIVKIIDKGDDAKPERIDFMLAHKRKIEEQIFTMMKHLEEVIRAIAMYEVLEMNKDPFEERSIIPKKEED